MKLDGMPAGVDAVRFGQLDETDGFYVLGNDGLLYAGGFGLIVTMEKSWTAEWDESTRQYRPVQHFDPAQVVTIEVTDSVKLAAATEVKAKIEQASKPLKQQGLSSIG